MLAFLFTFFSSKLAWGIACEYSKVSEVDVLHKPSTWFRRNINRVFLHLLLYLCTCCLWLAHRWVLCFNYSLILVKGRNQRRCVKWLLMTTPLRLSWVVRVFCRGDMVDRLIANKLLQLEQLAYWAMGSVPDFTQIDKGYKYGLMRTVFDLFMRMHTRFLRDDRH